MEEGQVILLTTIGSGRVHVTSRIRGGKLRVHRVSLRYAYVRANSVLLRTPTFQFFRFFRFACRPRTVVLGSRPLQLVRSLRYHGSFQYGLFLTIGTLRGDVTLFRYFLVVFFLALFTGSRRYFSVSLGMVLLRNGTRRENLTTFRGAYSRVGKCSNLFRGSVLSSAMQFGM